MHFEFLEVPYFMSKIVMNFRFASKSRSQVLQ